MKKRVLSVYPYILIFLFSLMGTYLIFYKGINTGDDYRFHFANIIEQYETLLSKHELSPISGILAMGLGSGTRLFYSPLPHLTVALLSLFMRLYNLGIIAAYKMVIVLTVFISGIFMYRFAMHFSKNNKVASLLAAACFVLYPYRLFDAFCRLAFAEAYSFMFLPLFFMGIYDITHDEKTKIVSFIEIIIGGSLLFLSHNLTAFFTFLVGIIYLLVNIKSIIIKFKDKRFISYVIISIFTLCGIASIAFISQLELMGLDIYNLTDDVRMWTNIEAVLKRTGQEFDYSGFLNVIYLCSKFKDYITLSSLIVGLIMYIIACIIFVILEFALKEIKRLKNFHLLISSFVLFLCVSLIDVRIEIYLGTIVFELLYLFAIFSKNQTISNKDKKIYKDSLFWFCIVMIIVMIFMMENKWIWTVLPSIMLKIQFPWRLWAIVQLLVSILVGLIGYYLNYKKCCLVTLSILVGFLIVSNEPLIEKRMVHHVNNGGWVNEIDYESVNYSSSLGWNKEYLPKVFYQADYQCEYSNSLYYKIVPKLTKNSHYSDQYDYYYEPIILNYSNGGNVAVNEAFSPYYDFNVDLNNDGSIIQMPLIYYPGYEICATNTNTNEVITLRGENIDGFVSFTLDQGSYQITTNYVATTARKISYVWFLTSIITLSGMIIYACIFENKKEKKDANKKSETK
ncbi:MAG: hypothetical protein MR270_01715 [Erysipelotrichaceae bacterium]|nr:hypothetical protein [Erysipelotrichaceae bacterium]